MWETTTGTATGRRAYGLRLLGLEHVGELLSGPASTGEITVEVRQVDAPAPSPVAGDADRAVTLLADGRHLELLRRPGIATFYGPRLAPDLLAHPYLAPVATTVNRWAGREAFHAGAFGLDGRAWVVLGPRTSGKSSLLAELTRRGVPVLSDDLVITDGTSVYTGPRCIDLRHPLPGVPQVATVARLGSRLRVALPTMAPHLPLGGWVFLRWGAPAMARVRPEELLTRVARARSGRQWPSDPLTLLQLSTRPAWDLVRPRDWAALPYTVEGLLRTLTGAAATDRDAA